MKKLVLAALVALTAGAASAGSLTIHNNGGYVVNTQDPGFHNVHTGQTHVIYNNTEDKTHVVKVKIDLIGHNQKVIRVGPNDDIHGHFWGTVFGADATWYKNGVRWHP